MKKVVCHYYELPLRVQESVLLKIIKDHKKEYESYEDFQAFDKLDALDYLKSTHLDAMQFEYSYTEGHGYHWRCLDFEVHDYEHIPHVMLV